MIHSKTAGSILIFAGICIGAGMLALPLSTSGTGFIISILLLMISAAISVVTSLLVLEVLSKAPTSIINFNSMSLYTLGKPGQYFCLFAYLSLLYSLSCAFVSGGTSLIGATLHAMQVNLSDTLLNCLYIFLAGIIVFMGHTTVDWCNRLLFSVKGVSFILLVSFLSSEIQLPNLLDHQNSYRFIGSAIPVLFFSFGLQIVVPSVYIYLDRDAGKTKHAIILGCLLPFIMYFIWLLVTLGIMPRYGAHSYADFLASYSNNDIGQFFLYINKGNNFTTALINIFANVAIATSFVTVTLSLKDFIRDIIKLPDSAHGNMYATLMTFVPTAILVSFAPNIFHKALNFSAAMTTFVLIFLPVAMVTSIRSKHKESDPSCYTAKGGTKLHLVLIVLGIVLFVTGMLASMQKLPVLS